MHLSYYLKKDSEHQGTIYVSVKLRGTRYRYSTRIKLASNNWINGYPKRNEKEIIKFLDKLTVQIENHFLSSNEYSKEILKNLIYQVNNHGNTDKLFVKDLISQYLSEKKSKVKEVTFEKVESQLNKFIDFIKNVEVANFNIVTINDYTQSLLLKKIEVTTYNSYIKNLRTFLKWAYVNDYIVDLHKKVKSIETIEKEIIAITHIELRQLIMSMNSKGEQIELNERLKKIRDLFVFACYTGLRFSDIFRVNRQMVQDINESEENSINQNCVLIIRQQKTKNIVRIPLTVEAYDILEKYNFEFQKISNQKANKYLKELFKLLLINRNVLTSKKIVGLDEVEDIYKPLNKVASFHLARKSFISIALSQGLKQKMVQKISGHKKDSIFNKYVTFTNEAYSKEIEKMSDLYLLLKEVKGRK